MLKGKVAIVTGGAQGIGKSISEALAKQGADIAICDVNLDGAKATAAELEKLGIRSAAFSVDVRDSKSVDEVVSQVIEKFSTVDILVNNAGITRDNLLMRMSEEEWDLVLDINLKGTFNFSKSVIRPMMKKRTGAIINVASIIGLIGNAGQTNYAASKAGVIALTKSVAKEVASRGIRVNAVAPGFIQTAMTDKLSVEIREAMQKNIPMAKFGLPEDVANVVLFLAGPLSSYMTGQVLTVSGGMVM